VQPFLASLQKRVRISSNASPDIYDGAAFARHGIVFASINYRLGRFGFFAFPELTR
jgi:para-nitrobenzyl esterase